jgi:hypothetical protein
MKTPSPGTNSAQQPFEFDFSEVPGKNKLIFFFSEKKPNKRNSTARCVGFFYPEVGW